MMHIVACEQGQPRVEVYGTDLMQKPIFVNIHHGIMNIDYCNTSHYCHSQLYMLLLCLV